jgi:hypothetical protein
MVVFSGLPLKKWVSKQRTNTTDSGLKKSSHRLQRASNARLPMSEARFFCKCKRGHKVLEFIDNQTAVLP